MGVSPPQVFIVWSNGNRISRPNFSRAQFFSRLDFVILCHFYILCTGCRLSNALTLWSYYSSCKPLKAPQYISDLITVKKATRCSLRSKGSSLLMPSGLKYLVSTLGDRSFGVPTPKLWNRFIGNKLAINCCYCQSWVWKEIWLRILQLRFSLRPKIQRE